MKPSAIFKIFQKGAKAAQRSKGKKGADGFVWPAGVRIGIYGHANAGKTVYFTVLNEDCKISKKLQIAVNDNATAGEFLSNYRHLWGVGTATGSGTVVDLRGEKKFPDPTQTEKLLLFNAIVDRKTKVPVVVYDYPGKAVSITDRDAASEKVADFMTGCDGLLFFFDPKLMGAELESQAHVASFVNMLELLAPLRSRLPIPVALVVTKADVLDGFSGDDQVILIPPEDEYIVSEDFELFLEKVLASPKVSSNPAWAATVRNFLIKMKDFLRVVVGRTLDFQIFFISATGNKPEKIGADIGRSIYAPPKIQPLGVKEPFYWLLNSILRNRRISAFRTVARWATLLSLVWIILSSMPFLFHFLYLYPQPQKIEASITKAYGGGMYGATDDERRRLITAYGNYERAWTVKWFFDEFQTPAARIRDAYSRYDIQQAAKNLDRIIEGFAAIVADTVRWPKVNPSDATPRLGEEHKNLLAALENFQKSDATSLLYLRSGRALGYWNLFVKAICAPATDTTAWQLVQEQVKADRMMPNNNLSPAETKLGDHLLTHKVEKIQEVVAAQAATQLDDIIKTVNSKPSADFRLDTAVAQLREVRGSLNPTVDRASIAMIDKYLTAAEVWNSPRKYRYKVESVPGEGHLHVEVASRGKDPTWAVHETMVPGHEYTLQWGAGDVIYIALDTLGQTEDWGDRASDKVKLGMISRFAIFEMDGDIRFENIGKKVTITFLPGLRDQIPKLEKQ